MTTKCRRIISLLSAAVLLLLTLLVLLVVLPRLRNQPIRIKTQLSPDEVADVVELSSGTLYFKDEETIVKELTKEERRAYAAIFSLDNTRKSDSVLINSSIGAVELRQQLNIDPRHWRLPERCELYKREDIYDGLLVYVDDAGEEYCNKTVFYAHYSNRSNDSISVDVAAAERRSVYTAPRPSEYSIGESRNYLFDRKWLYGELDSRIGDAPVSVVRNKYGNFWAYMIVGNASYNIESYGLTQQEFVELLISIYEAPRPVTQSVIDYIREQTEAEQTGT